MDMLASLPTPHGGRLFRRSFTGRGITCTRASPADIVNFLVSGEGKLEGCVLSSDTPFLVATGPIKKGAVLVSVPETLWIKSEDNSNDQDWIGLAASLAKARSSGGLAGPAALLPTGETRYVKSYIYTQYPPYSLAYTNIFICLLRR